MIHTKSQRKRRDAGSRLRVIRWAASGLIALMAGATSAKAHQLWLDREGDTYLLHQGHLGDAHAGLERVPYRAGFVQSATCVDQSGAKRTPAWTQAYPARFPAQCAALLVGASSGYWTKTPWETHNLPKDQIAGALQSWRSEESVKRIDRWTAVFAKPLGPGLELSVLQDPAPLVPGDKLRLLVSYGGRPRAGVPVAYDGAIRGASAEDGSILLKLRRGGLQIISASLELPVGDQGADRLILATTLNFLVAQP